MPQEIRGGGDYGYFLALHIERQCEHVNFYILPGIFICFYMYVSGDHDLPIKAGKQKKAVCCLKRLYNLFQSSFRQSKCSALRMLDLL